MSFSHPSFRFWMATLLLVTPLCAQNFLQPKVIPTGNWPAAVYTADVNADGIPDLIYIDQGAAPNASSTTHILLGDGKGGFTASATLSTSGNTLALGDLTGDGRIDIGWLYSTSTTVGSSVVSTVTLSIAPNAGGGKFSTTLTQTLALTLLAKPVQFGYLTAGRMHTSGPLDMLAGDPNNGVILDLQYLNPGASFSAYQLLTPPKGVGPMVIADLNGDGVNDLTINSQSAFTVETILGSGSGGFPSGSANGSQTTLYHSSNLSGIRSLLIKDVNGDGRPDLISEDAAGHIDVFAGNGDGTFSSTSSGGTGPLNGLTGNGGHLIAISDFNHDGLPDALAATPAGVSVLLGSATSYLGLKGIYNAGPGQTSYTTADFNGDGNLDLAVDSPEGIAILYGNADGSFQTSLAYPAGQPALSAAIGKITTSGHLDAVVSTAATQAQLFRGAGDGTFAYVGNAPGTGTPSPTSSQTGPAGLWSTVQLGDFNADGLMDLAFTADGPNALLPTSGSGLAIQFGDGAGAFAAPVAITAQSQFTNPNPASCTPPFTQYPGMFYGTSVVADFNGDGIPDIANHDSGAFRIMRGNNSPQAQNGIGDPTLYWSNVDGNQTGTTVACALHAHDLTILGDLNNDGTPDVIFQDAGSLNVYLNGSTSKLVWTGDLSVNGSLTTAGQLTAPALAPNFGGTVAASAGGLGFPAFIGSAAVADLDKDGNNDLIVAYANLSANLQAPTTSAPNYLYIWYGSGSGQFLTSAKHPVNPVRLTPSRNFYQVALADVNADGIPDLILSDGYILSIQLGKGDGTFGSEVHYLAGQGINTLSTGDVNGDGMIDLILANGGAVLSNPVANLDSLGSNPDVNTGGITVLLNKPLPALVTPTGNVSANPEPSTYGAAFTLSATLQGTNSGGSPTGTVAFSVDGVAAGTGTLSSGIASVAYAAGNSLAAGNHTLSAIYSGDNTYSTITLTGTHAVTSPAAAITVTASPEPSAYGSSFTLTGTLLANGGPGTFSFGIDGNPLGSVHSTTGTASIAGPANLSVGTHTLQVGWTADQSAIALAGNGSHVVTQASPSIALRLCVDPTGQTQSSFPCSNPLSNTPLVSPINMYYGQTLDGVAIESSTYLTGTISFYANTTVFCTINAALQAGGSVCPTNAGNLLPGNYIVKTVYSGDANDAPATSNSIAVNVAADLTTATTTASVTTAVVGTPVTFTGKVTGNYAIPTGSIVFLDGTTPIGNGTLDLTGTATFTINSLAIGTHEVSISYAGNSNFNPTGSSPVTVIITAAVQQGPASFTLNVSPSPLTLGVGRTGILLVTITPINSFNQPVQLSCSGLPIETSCNFVETIVPPHGAATTLQLLTAAPHDCNDPSQPYFLGSNALGTPKTLWAGVLLLAAGLFRARRRMRSKLNGSLLLLALTLIGLSAVSGCGHCTDLGTRPGTYSFTVTATAQGGPVTETQTQTIPLTMTIE